MDYATKGLCMQYLRALAGYVGDSGEGANRLLILESLGWERRWARSIESYMHKEGWIKLTDEYTVYLTEKGRWAAGSGKSERTGES